MESMEYIDKIKSEYGLNDYDVLDILEYLRYIARDNKEYDADSFLGELCDEIDK